MAGWRNAATLSVPRRGWLLEDEGRRLGKRRQQRGRRIKQRAAADLSLVHAVDYCLRVRPGAENTGKPPALAELTQQDLRLDLAPAIDENGVVGRQRRPAGLKGAMHRRDVGCAELAGQVAAALDASGIVLERDHAAGQPRENRRRIAAVAGYIEDLVLISNLESLDETSQHHRLDERALGIG